jgi:hypothetical protein
MRCNSSVLSIHVILIRFLTSSTQVWSRKPLASNKPLPEREYRLCRLIAFENGSYTWSKHGDFSIDQPSIQSITCPSEAEVTSFDGRVQPGASLSIKCGFGRLLEYGWPTYRERPPSGSLDIVNMIFVTRCQLINDFRVLDRFLTIKWNVRTWKCYLVHRQTVSIANANNKDVEDSSNSGAESHPRWIWTQG